MLEKCVLTIVKLNWNQRMGHEKLPSSGHVVHTTATRTSSKCQKMKNSRTKRAKILFFIVKYANLCFIVAVVLAVA